MKDLIELTKDANDIAIAGHLRPDGDCVGACVATWRYLKNACPHKEIRVYLETLPEVFSFLDPKGEILSNHPMEGQVDLFIALDSSSTDRLGEAKKSFEAARKTICIDHHVSNLNYADENFIEPDASSTCEVLFEMMKTEEIDISVASALYIGMIFDSGVFRYSSTSRHTMEVAGILMEKGIPFWEYIDQCFYERSYSKTKLLGETLQKSTLIMDERGIVSTITQDMMEKYGTKTEDIDGIIDELRITKGTDIAILFHELKTDTYKVSMRSNEKIDVSIIALHFGGGGHKKAAGCTVEGTYQELLAAIIEQIKLQYA